MAVKENSKKVLEFVRANESKNITAADIAEGTGLPVRSVNGIVTSAFQRKGYMVRTEAEVELEDGSHAKVKFITLTDEGKTHDFDAEDDKDAE